MTEAEALARLRAALAPDEPPALTPGALEQLLARFRVADDAGLGPRDPGYVPTWNIARAASEGWKQKASIAASRFDLSTDGQSLSRSQIVANCLRMAEVYARGTFVNAPVRGALGDELRDDWDLLHATREA